MKRRNSPKKDATPQRSHSARVPSAAAPRERPDIYRFHDYREFLKAWIEYRRQTERGFSLRKLANDAGVAPGYLPMILGGTRPLTLKLLPRLSRVLGLGRPERSYLEALVTLGTTDSPEVRQEALERMKRFRAYQARNPKEIEVYRYLSRWYLVAIRELAALPDFSEEPEWIRARLRDKVSVAEVKEALEFLLGHGFLKKDAQGKYLLPEKDLSCMGGVYKIALGEFHRQMFAQASDSIETIPSIERNILGHTFAFDSGKLEEARKILDETLERLRKLTVHASQADGVYHVEMALFPLTGKPEERKS